MKRFFCLLATLGLLAGTLSALDFDLGFSPGGTALKDVLAAIGTAKQTVVVAAYEFTSAPVAQALADAVGKGLKVWVIMDARAAKSKYSQAPFLVSHGVALRTEKDYAIFHHKFLVVDRSTVETGSFNYTASADSRNAENVLVLRGVPDLAEAYLREWVKLWDEAETYVPPKS